MSAHAQDGAYEGPERRRVDKPYHGNDRRAA
jgi:hypothetical protein